MTLSPDTLRPETLNELEASLDQMKTANYFLRVALDQAPEGVLIIEAEPSGNAGPQILFSNVAAAVLVGVEPEKGLRGMALSDLAVGDLDAATLLQSLNLAVENGGSHECECRIQNFYGQEPQRCRWRVRAVFNSLRRLLNYTLLVSPMPMVSAAAAKTVPLKADDLDTTSDQLKKDNLAALAQGIAHDVNNLLGPVTMRLSDLIQKIGGDPALNEELQLIFSGLKRARQFTSQVVTACKARPQDKKPVDLVPIVRDTVKFASAGANVQVNVRLGEHLRWAVADGTKISQVLQNLILNGIQAMPQGGHMDVDVENTDIALGQDAVLKPGLYVRLAVRDRGCGIAPENLDRLFRESFTTKADGNGIGLTTCKRFIKEHEGDIRVTSRLNVGTEFTILLPAVPQPAPETGAVSAPSDNAPVPLKHGQGRVLIVDDEDDLRKVAHMILKRCGYEVVETDNGQDAVKIYQSLARTGTAPDVVLMDLTLRGGMNGGETAAEILQFDPDARLVVTSGVNEDVQMTYLEKGFVGVLPKPYEAGELTQMVHQVITMMHR